MENQANFLILVHKVGMCSFWVYLWALKEIFCLRFFKKYLRLYFWEVYLIVIFLQEIGFRFVLKHTCRMNHFCDSSDYLNM